MKFGVPMQILIARIAKSPKIGEKVCAHKHVTKKIKILQIQNGEQPPYWKSSVGYISAIYCPINAKLGMTQAT